MPTGLKAYIIYSIGGAVFVKVLYEILNLIGVPSRTALFIALPAGVIGFLVFIFLNRDSNFDSVMHKGGWRRRFRGDK